MESQEITKKDTKYKIIKAFWKLYQTSELDRITVKNVTDESGIYRTTFYLHFSDIYAVLELIEETLLENLRAIDEKAGVRKAVDEMHRVMETDYVFLRVLLDGKHDEDFAAVYKKEMAEKFCRVHGITPERVDEKSWFLIQKTLIFLTDLMFQCAGSDQFTFGEAVEIMDGYMDEGVIPTIQKMQEKMK